MELEEIGPRGRNSAHFGAAELKEMKVRVKQLQDIAEFNRENHGPMSTRYKESLLRYNAEKEKLIDGGGSYGRACGCCCIC